MTDFFASDIVVFSAIFLLVALAAKKIGSWFSMVGLPYITGYLLTGMIAGPFILDLLPSSAVAELRYIDELALGVIAFVAGSELYLVEIRARLNTIATVTGSMLIIAMPIIGVGLYALTGFLPFAVDMGTTGRVAIALLGGAILLALSPASTIAVIKETRAKGPFTRTILGITVTMDVVIVVVFAIAVAIASGLLTGVGFNLSFAVIIVVDLALAIGAGIGVGWLLSQLFSSKLNRTVQMLLMLGIGYLIFLLAFQLIDFSKTALPFELHAEPILIAMIAGFYVTNFTQHRDRFAHMLHDVGPAIYVAFFTLTGVAVKLDLLADTWPIALALFGLRAGGIFLGSSVGGALAGETGVFRRYAWLGLITQAGIALGLAREVAVEFPQLGDSFATLVVSVVVLNELLGPLLLKIALRNSGETAESGATEAARDAVIVGIETQSLELARQLQSAGWYVTLVDTNPIHVNLASNGSLVVHHVADMTSISLEGLITRETDAVIALHEFDASSLAVCEYAHHIGVPRLIVRLHDMSQVERFRELGALVVDQASAMVYLLEQSVRSPQTAAMLLHQDSGREMVQITVNNPDIDGTLVRDLRLPIDVLLLDVNRRGNPIVPHGYTKLQLKDEVTILGHGDSLDEVVMKMGY
jgi:Trk K+ transport system NAD-binding subunit/Kef-type K+ transport system membrane component KefB